VRVENVQDHSQNDESGADPLGGAGQLGVQALGLALGQERIGSAADNAETGVLAGLEQNGQNNHQTGEQLQDSNQSDSNRRQAEVPMGKLR